MKNWHSKPFPFTIFMHISLPRCLTKKICDSKSIWNQVWIGDRNSDELGWRECDHLCLAGSFDSLQHSWPLNVRTSTKARSSRHNITVVLILPGQASSNVICWRPLDNPWISPFSILFNIFNMKLLEEHQVGVRCYQYVNNIQLYIYTIGSRGDWGAPYIGKAALRIPPNCHSFLISSNHILSIA